MVKRCKGYVAPCFAGTHGVNFKPISFNYKVAFHFLFLEWRDEAGAMLGIGGEEMTCDPDHVTTLKMSKHSFCIVQMVNDEGGAYSRKERRSAFVFAISGN